MGVSGYPLGAPGPTRNMVVLSWGARHIGPVSPHTTLPPGSRVPALWLVFPFGGAGDSATGSMWQEVGTVSHGVAQYPPFGSRDIYGQRPQATERA